MKSSGKRGGNRGGVRPTTPIEQKTVISGKVRVRIDPAREMVITASVEDRLLAQRLMLYDWPGVRSIDDLFVYALRQLDAAH